MDGRSIRWEAHNASQRDRIVQAALDLIEETGDVPPLLDVGRRAGVSRSVLYRQFADRDDLEAAIQTRGLAMFWEAVEPALRIEGTVRESVTRAATVFVRFAQAHRQLFLRADQSRAEDSMAQRSVDLVASSLGQLFITTFRAVGAEVSEADAEATDPLTYGLVNGVYAAIRRWLVLGAKVPDEAHLIGLLVEAAEALLTSRLREYGIAVDFDANADGLISRVAP